MLSKFSNVSASRARRTIKASEGIEVAHWPPLPYYLHFIFTPLVTFQFKTKSNENYFTKKTCESTCRKKKKSIFTSKEWELLREGELCGPFCAKTKKFVGVGSQTPVCILTVRQTETGNNSRNNSSVLHYEVHLFTDSFFLRMVIPGLSCMF